MGGLGFKGGSGHVCESSPFIFLGPQSLRAPSCEENHVRPKNNDQKNVP